MKKLNFYPFYIDLLKNKSKTTTIRLDDKRHLFKLKDEVEITVGWNENDATYINEGIVIDIIYKQLKDLNMDDIKGESPDCLSLNAIKYVMSSIYRKIVKDDDYVTIIKWNYA